MDRRIGFLVESGQSEVSVGSGVWTFAIGNEIIDNQTSAWWYGSVRGAAVWKGGGFMLLLRLTDVFGYGIE